MKWMLHYSRQHLKLRPRDACVFPETRSVSSGKLPKQLFNQKPNWKLSEPRRRWQLEQKGREGKPGFLPIHSTGFFGYSRLAFAFIPAKRCKSDLKWKILEEILLRGHCYSFGKMSGYKQNFCLMENKSFLLRDNFGIANIIT